MPELTCVALGLLSGLVSSLETGLVSSLAWPGRTANEDAACPMHSSSAARAIVMHNCRMASVSVCVSECKCLSASVYVSRPGENAWQVHDLQYLFWKLFGFISKVANYSYLET